MDIVNWLFVDMNSYFASVEQQEQPALRGRPIAVVPVAVASGCCIAASYEAKAFGVRTGMRVAEAQALCPSLHLVLARPPLYVHYHHKIVEAIDSCVPVASILSIDEMICQLTGSQRNTQNAFALASTIKQAIAERVGAHVRASIGLAPNRFLAKLASDMKKPDGLILIKPDDLPEALFSLKLQDLPGIGRRMERHLNREGVRTVQELCSLNPREMRLIWGGVTGERFWRSLRGEDLEERLTVRRSISHSHVLEPALRTQSGAFRIAQKLTCKLGVRLRKMGYRASHMTLAVQHANGSSTESKTKLDEVQDTPTLLKTLRVLWERIPARSPVWVGVTLDSLVPEERHTPSFLNDARQERLSFVMDKLNDAYGKNTAYFASLAAFKNKAPTRIGFTRVPDASEM